MKYLVLIIFGFILDFHSFNQDSGKDSINTDCTEVAENCFYDFIWNFMMNEDFQLSRTKIKSWKYVNYLKNYDYSLHFFQSFKISDEEFEKDLTFEKRLTIINTETKNKSELVFKKHDSKWFLIKKLGFKFFASNTIDFESFIYKFSTDNTFAKKHIKFPLKHVYLDHEKDYADTTVYLTKETVYNYDFINKGKLIFMHDTKFKNAKKITIYLRGYDGGLSTYYYFEKIENEWMLVEDRDLST